MVDHWFALEGGTVASTEEAGRQVIEAGFCVLFVHVDGRPNRTVPLRP